MSNWSSSRRLIAVLLLLVAGCSGESIAIAVEPPAVERPASAAKEVPGTSDPGVRRLAGKTAAPQPLAVDAAGRLVAVATPCECIVYDLENGEERRRWNDGTRVAAFTRDGRFLVATGPGRVTLWDTDGFVERARITGHPPAWPAQIARDHSQPIVSDDADLVAVPNGRRSFDQGQPAGMLIYGRDGGLRHVLPVPDDAEMGEAVFLRDDRLLLSFCDTDDEGHCWRSELWDPVTGRRIHAFPRSESVIGTPGGRWIAVGKRPWDRRPRDARPMRIALAIHEVESGRQTGVIEDDASLVDFVWRPDGARLLAAIGNRVIEWDMTGGDFVVTFESNGDPDGRPAYGPDGRRFATVTEPTGIDEDVEHLLRGWDAATGEQLPIATVCVGYNSCDRLVFLGAGERFISMDAPFAVRDTCTGETLQTVPEYPEPVREAAWIDADHFLIDDLLSDAATGRQRRWELPGHRHTPLRDGRTMFSYGYSGGYLTNVASGITTLWAGPDSPLALADVATDPDLRRAVFACRSQSQPHLFRIIVLDASRLDEPLVLHRCATAVAVRPDARTFLAASHDGIDELDGATGGPVRSFGAPPGRVLFVTWSADGTSILAGGVRGHDDVAQPVTAEDAGWALVIDAATGRTLALDGHTGAVTTGAFSADGRRCVTGSLDTTVRLWSTASGEAIHCFRGHRGAVHRVAYGPRGDRILSAAEDGALLWDVAGVVDPAMKPGPLAEAFEVVETINALRPPNVVVSKLLPSEWAGSTPPATSRVGWPVIHVGDNVRYLRWDAPWTIREWLARAPIVGMEPVATPGPIHRAEAFPGANLVGTSRDGGRRLLETPNHDAFIVADDRNRVLARVDRRPPFQWDLAEISPSGRHFVATVEVERPPGPRADGRYEVTIHNADTGRATRTFDIAAWCVNAVSFDPLDRTLLLHINNDILDLRDIATGRQLGRVEGDAGPGAAYSPAAYSPDGRFLMTHEYPDLVIHVRDALTLDTIRSLENHLPFRWSHCSPDGRRLLVGQHYAENVTLITSWDVETGTRGWSRCGPAGKAGTFSADGRLYLTNANDYVWALWDVERGTILRVIVSPKATPVFGPGGDTLHQHTPDGPQLWPPATD